MNKEEIKTYIPHREPFLFVDEVLEFEPYKRILAVKTFPATEEFFKGHFPGHPVVPGVILTEALAQAAAVLLGASVAKNENAEDIVGCYLMGLDKVKFRKVVNPDDEIKLEVDVLKLRSKIVTFKASAYVDESKAAEAEFMATFY
ncbi:MAG: 3-hydroxyacyl-ACP dehydratase FabZ [Candidatus Dadabacteria bacterium]|jgi:3-hydroxyacyl-[acyl-carrier-protein] dehydratase|nr:MAG: 3-hydroxyacyl-ACP dehydratase FabZ [Thermodesulfobacteriales bacterium]